MCSIRDYDHSDYDACLRIFASNAPLFVDSNERTAYARFLSELPCSYLVAELAGSVVGCGGFYFEPDECLASLVWGMIAGDFHGQGIGTFLLQARLARITADPSVCAVRAKTSQRTAPFFHRFGFRTERIFEHRFGPGLHQHEMYLRMPSRSHVPSPNQTMQPTAGQRTAPLSDD